MVRPSIKTILILMSVAITLSLGSFFLPSYIAYIIDKDRANAIELGYGKELRLPAYYRYLKRSSDVGSTDWVTAAEFLSRNNPSVSTELAEYYWSVNNVDKAKFWFVQATKKNMTTAKYRLAQLYATQNLYLNAYQLLFETDISFTEDVPEKTLLLALELAVWAGDKPSITKLSLLIDTAAPIITELHNFGILSAYSKKTANIHCVNGIEMFATNLSDLRHIENLKDQIQVHKLSQFLCITAVRYIPLKSLQCTHAKEKKIECNEAVWQQYAEDIGSRYIGVVVPEGGANVHKGILYMDSGDTVEVFSHELAHLLGFIDEYPLPVNHAKCLSEQQGALSHNIAVLTPEKIGSRSTLRANILEQLSWGHMIKPDTPIMVKAESGWQLGTPEEYTGEVGLFPSQTCIGKRTLRTGDAVNAYKPVSQLTQMNYFELEFPSVYLQILSNQPDKFLMPSFHVNIADAIN